MNAESCVTDSKRIKLSDEASSTAQLSPATQETDAPSNSGEDVLELERDRNCKDMKEKVKRKFLVDMPDDFYQLWDFCKSIKPHQPQCELV